MVELFLVIYSTDVEIISIPRIQFGEDLFITLGDIPNDNNQK